MLIGLVWFLQLSGVSCSLLLGHMALCHAVLHGRSGVCHMLCLCLGAAGVMLHWSCCGKRPASGALAHACAIAFDWQTWGQRGCTIYAAAGCLGCYWQCLCCTCTCLLRTMLVWVLRRRAAVLWHLGICGPCCLCCADRRVSIACLVVFGQASQDCASQQPCVVARCFVVACSQVCCCGFVAMYIGGCFCCFVVVEVCCGCWEGPILPGSF